METVHGYTTEGFVTLNIEKKLHAYACTCRAQRGKTITIKMINQIFIPSPYIKFVDEYICAERNETQFPEKQQFFCDK